MELGKVLLPLETFKEKMLVVRGLYNAEAGKGGIHSAQTGNLLTGAALEGGGGIHSGVSMDQLLAQKIGQQTKVPSLVLGCEPSISALHKGYSMIYSSHISWNSPTTPTPLELYPALAFDRLFRDEVGRGDASVLDVRPRRRPRPEQPRQRRRPPQAGRIPVVGARGRAAHRRRRASRADSQGWRPTLDKPNMPRPADGMPQDVDQHMRLMCDILVLAFQTDTTRICTLKLNNDHSSLRFPKLGVDYMIHHLLSHTDNADWLKVNQFFAQQVAYIAGKARPDSGGRADLPSTTRMILYLSSMHARQHPRLLAAAGGAARPGRRPAPDGPRRSITWASRTARCAACTCP